MRGNTVCLSVSSITQYDVMPYLHALWYWKLKECKSNISANFTSVDNLLLCVSFNHAISCIISLLVWFYPSKFIREIGVTLLTYVAQKKIEHIKNC